MKLIVQNYSCLQNPWLGGYRPQIPVLSILSSTESVEPPPNPSRTKFLDTPLVYSGTSLLTSVESIKILLEWHQRVSNHWLTKSVRKLWKGIPHSEQPFQFIRDWQQHCDFWPQTTRTPIFNMLYRFLHSHIVPKVCQAVFEALKENGGKNCVFVHNKLFWYKIDGFEHWKKIYRWQCISCS